MNISPINYSAEVVELLEREGLPTSDIDSADNIQLFGVNFNDAIGELIGVEVQDSIGLLRSLVVDDRFRGKGYGQDLVAFAESWARKEGISEFYLLTTTADKFFEKFGYKQVQRDQAPSFIANTSQFSSLCPSSAIFMRKIIAE